MAHHVGGFQFQRILSGGDRSDNDVSIRDQAENPLPAFADRDAPAVVDDHQAGDGFQTVAGAAAGGGRGHDVANAHGFHWKEMESARFPGTSDGVAAPEKEMETTRPDLATVLTTAHPARPYFVLGGALCVLGLIRNNLGSLLFLGAGGAVLVRGLEEMRRIEALHGGNTHGTNAPPL